MRRRPKCQTRTCPGEERPSAPVAPTAASTTPESGSQTDPPSHNNQAGYYSKGVGLEILQLKSELESSEERRGAMEVRLQAAESRLQATEQRLVGMEIQISELLRVLELRLMGDGALNCVGDAGSAPPGRNVDLQHGLNVPTAAHGGSLTPCTAPLQTVSWESYLSMEVEYNPVDPLPDLAFPAH